MSYAVVMAYVDANSMPEQRVRLAASLAEKFNSTLFGLSALAIHPPFLIGGVAIQQATPADIVEIMATLTANGDWFAKLRPWITRGSNGGRYWIIQVTRWRVKRGVPISS